MEKDKSSLLNTLAPIAAGIGTYALARKGLFKSQAQKASKGKLTWLLDEGEKIPKAGNGVLDKIKHWATHSDINYAVAGSKKMPKKVEGALYSDTSAHDVYRYPLTKGDIDYNADKKKIIDLFQDKYRFSKLKSDKTIVPSKRLDKVIGDTDDINMFAKRLSKQKKSYVKLKEDWASGGDGHFSKSDFKELKDSLKKGKTFREDPTPIKRVVDTPTGPKTRTTRPASIEKKVSDLYRNSNKYIIQPNVNLKTDTEFVWNSTKPVSEQRINFVLSEGKVKPMGAHTRWYTEESPSILKQMKTKREFASKMQGIVDSNKKLQKGNYVLGADVVRTKKDKMKIIEVNDQSGYLYPGLTDERPLNQFKTYLEPGNLYKTITGRDTKPRAMLKGIAAAGTTAVGGKFFNDQRNK